MPKFSPLTTPQFRTMPPQGAERRADAANNDGSSSSPWSRNPGSSDCAAPMLSRAGWVPQGADRGAFGSRLSVVSRRLGIMNWWGATVPTADDAPPRPVRVSRRTLAAAIEQTLIDGFTRENLQVVLADELQLR